MPTRRVAFWSLLLVLGFLTTTVTAGSIPSDLREIHLLDRLGFGPRPGNIERIRSIGVDRYLEEQLSPKSIPLPQNLTTRVESLETLRRSSPELFIEYGPPSYGGKQGDKEAAKRGRQRARVILDQGVEARLLRAVESPRQFEEVMVNFWFNHFNVFSQKGLDHLWIGSYEEEAIRPHVLGRFRDLLGATAKHPAMLFYLDNWQNTAPNSPGARGRFKGLNENYARELMELHTLGVDGGYTQTDVITLARILTGWGFRRPGQALQQGTVPGRIATVFAVNAISSNGFYFDANRHDFSTKVFLGRTIRASGLGEGEEALDILSQHPSTARHISYKIAQYFVTDDPPKSLVERLAGRFSDTRGDIRAVLDTLFHSPEFWDEQYVGKKFKTPYEYVISAVRAIGDPVVNTRPLRAAMAQLGMPLYGCQTPNGHKNVRDAWLNPNAMTQRLNFATALGAGRLRVTEQPANAMDQMTATAEKRADNQMGSAKPVDSRILLKTVGNKISEQTRATVEDSPPALRAALILGSPDFMHR
ncbi:MAG: DUF1800 domain-containing protein [Deltaproteobacteria bacterium]|nr:DUF1800 domain-containing protein [Deltaproteobacteria bacterium]